MPKGVYLRTIETSISIRAARLRAGKHSDKTKAKIAESIKRWHESRKKVVTNQENLARP